MELEGSDDADRTGLYAQEYIASGLISDAWGRILEVRP